MSDWVKLRFRARGGVMVVNHAAAQPDGSAARYVGRKFDASGASKSVAGSWPAKPEGEEISSPADLFSEWAREVKEGSLWAGDEATATMLGVKFDSKFGGEYDEPKAAAPPAKPAQG